MSQSPHVIRPTQQPSACPFSIARPRFAPKVPATKPVRIVRIYLKPTHRSTAPVPARDVVKDPAVPSTPQRSSVIQQPETPVAQPAQLAPETPAPKPMRIVRVCRRPLRTIKTQPKVCTHSIPSHSRPSSPSARQQCPRPTTPLPVRRVASPVVDSYRPQDVATAHLRFRSPETELLYPRRARSPQIAPRRPLEHLRLHSPEPKLLHSDRARPPQIAPRRRRRPQAPVPRPISPAVDSYNPGVVATAHLRFSTPEHSLLYPKDVPTPPSAKIELWKTLSKLSLDHQLKGRVDITPPPAPKIPEAHVSPAPSVTTDDLGSNLLDGSVPMYLLAAGIKNKRHTPAPERPSTPSHLRCGITDYALTPPRIWWKEGSHPDPPRRRRRYLEDDTTDEYDESRSIASGKTHTWTSTVGLAAAAVGGLVAWWLMAGM